MKVASRFYNCTTKKYYKATYTQASCVDDGILKVKLYLCRQHKLSMNLI